MADKNVTFPTPANTDVLTVLVRYKAGVPTDVESTCIIKSADGMSQHDGECGVDPTTLPAALQTELANLATQVATATATKYGF